MTIQEQIDTNILTVSSDEEGVRLDKLLADRFQEKSRSYFQYLIEKGCVLLNGKEVKKRAFAKADDEIEIFFCQTPEVSIEAEEIPLEILYEDEHLIAVNKPHGMVVHPAPGNWSGTFVNALINHCKDLVLPENDVRPGIVHRLDKETSGVLLAAKTLAAHQKLIALFSQRKIEKEYLAICHSKPRTGACEAPIGRHPTKRKEMCVIDSGKPALTDFHLLATDNSLSLILAKPKTGRTHQIRVHLQHLNASVIGDKTYGRSTQLDQKTTRHLLHAYRVKFNHPITNAPLDIVAPIADDMKQVIKKFLYSSINKSC